MTAKEKVADLVGMMLYGLGEVFTQFAKLILDLSDDSSPDDQAGIATFGGAGLLILPR